MPLPHTALRGAALALALQALHAQAQDAGSERIDIQDRRDTAASQEPTQVLQGDKLRRRVAPTLGATLQSEPGVANASFGPNVGLPVIRGLSGTRVGVTVGGSGTNDASTLSADHAVMTEPLLARSITVWKGPSAVRFGGGAIGGAVEIENGRIPRALPQDTELSTTAIGGTSMMAGLAALNGGSGNFAWHADVHGRRQGDVQIPGWALDEYALQQQFGLITARNTYGYIANTNARSNGGALGGSFIGERGWLGASLSTFRQNYGIPPGGHTDAVPPPGSSGIVDEQVRIDAKQNRLDLAGEFDLPWATSPVLSVRGASSDYAHDELANSVLETTFTKRVNELRSDIAYNVPGLWWQGSRSTGFVGVQMGRADFSALGKEVFVPKTRTDSIGMFAIDQTRYGSWRFESGARVESVHLTPQSYQVSREDLQLLKIPPERSFLPVSVSLSASHDWPEGFATLSLWSAQRAPALQELYADGPHLASRTFDIGNERLQTETLRGLNLGFERRFEPLRVYGNVFGYRSSSYIYQRSLGRFYNIDSGSIRFECARLELCLPVTRYEQAPATLSGYELGVAWPWELAALGAGIWRIDTDSVRGRLDSGQDLPRLPPARIAIAVEGRRDAWSGEARLAHAFAQTRPGENETPTDAWTQFNLSLRYAAPPRNGLQWSVFAAATNVFNAEARNSASFLRNYAPEPGRQLQLGVEVQL